eukprot:5790968-Prymnesium_polylepis.3
MSEPLLSICRQVPPWSPERMVRERCESVRWRRSGVLLLRLLRRTQNAEEQNAERRTQNAEHKLCPRPCS